MMCCDKLVCVIFCLLACALHFATPMLKCYECNTMGLPLNRDCVTSSTPIVDCDLVCSTGIYQWWNQSDPTHTWNRGNEANVTFKGCLTKNHACHPQHKMVNLECKVCRGDYCNSSRSIYNFTTSILIVALLFYSLV